MVLESLQESRKKNKFCCETVCQETGLARFFVLLGVRVKTVLICYQYTIILKSFYSDPGLTPLLFPDDHIIY